MFALFSHCIEGKRMAERCAEEFASIEGRGAVVLKPGAIYGTRHTSGGLPIPLTPIMAPLSWGITSMPGLVAAATRALPALLDGALVPPVSVLSLAETAVDGALSKESGLQVIDGFALVK